NRMSAELILRVGERHWAGFDAADVAAVRQSLQKKASEDPDFWSVVGLIELRIYEALAQRHLATVLGGILAELQDLKTRVSAPHLWASGHAQARFTLQPYIGAARLAEAEREAAGQLLAQLQDHAALSDGLSTRELSESSLERVMNAEQPVDDQEGLRK